MRVVDLDGRNSFSRSLKPLERLTSCRPSSTVLVQHSPRALHRKDLVVGHYSVYIIAFAFDGESKYNETPRS